MSQQSEKNHDQNPKPKRTASYVFFSVLLLCLLAVGGVAVSTFSENLQNTVIVEEATPSSTATTTTTASPVVVTPATTTEAVTTTQTTAPIAPLYVCPLSGDILTAFSETPIYNDTMADHRTHRAVDFAGTVGDEIVAFSDGDITEVGDDLLLGAYVTIDHGDGIVSRYGGVKAAVNIGDHVETGARIGTLTDIPFEAHLTPHLHFEVTQNGQPIDATSLWT